jgi:hypothetical protein
MNEAAVNVTIEFTGAARGIVGQKKISLELAEQSTYQDMIRLLGKRYPALINLLINTDGESLMSGNMLVINGDLATPAFVMQDSPQDGEFLILMSIVTGG